MLKRPAAADLERGQRADELLTIEANVAEWARKRACCILVRTERERVRAVRLLLSRCLREFVA